MCECISLLVTLVSLYHRHFIPFVSVGHNLHVGNLSGAVNATLYIYSGLFDAEDMKTKNTAKKIRCRVTKRSLLREVYKIAETKMSTMNFVRLSQDK